MIALHNKARILGIDPSTRGFGFVVIEINGRVLHRGVAQVPSRETADLLKRIEILCDEYGPDIIALEDCRTTYRGLRAQREINSIVGFAQLYEIRCALVSRSDVRKTLNLVPRATKHQIATRLGELLPELLPLLPPRRRPWEAERERMNVFDAAGLALVAIQSNVPEQLAA